MDINVQIIDMDVMIGEQVVENADGSVTVFLNARHTRENQKRFYAHALKHLRNNDFEKECADAIETDAHYMEISKELCV